MVFAMAYWFTQYEVQDWVRDQMKSDFRAVLAIHAEDGPAAMIATVERLAAVNFENARIYQIVDANGAVVAGNITSAFSSPVPDRIDAQDTHLAQLLNSEIEEYWLREDQIGPYRLILGSGDHIVAEVLEALSFALAIGYLIVVTLGLIVGVRIGRMTEQRIAEISATLSNIADGQLDARIPRTGTVGDDLTRVSTAINAMLDQIKRLLESQQQISTDIAHDMRTPLQHLRQRLETLRDSPAIAPDDVSDSLTQTEEIIATFNALLRIAQIEAGDRRERFARTDMSQIIANVADAFEPAAEDEGVSLTVTALETALTVWGDRDLLTQMLANLVENAIKHCPPGSHIQINCEARRADIILRITDDGPGIEQADHQRIFQRFFRGEKSRSSAGNGLGLALVKAIVDMHNGTVMIIQSTTGAVFEIRLPNDADAERA